MCGGVKLSNMLLGVSFVQCSAVRGRKIKERKGKSWQDGFPDERNPLLMFTSKPTRKQARMTLNTTESYLKTIKGRPQKGDS